MEKEKTGKKDHILDVAEGVFAEYGYDGASTRLISGEAGVNMAMLNYYFGSKEDLMLSIFERKTSLFRSLIQDIDNNDSISSWQKVVEFIEAYIGRVFNNNCFQKMMYQEMSVRRTGELAEKIMSMIMQNVFEFRKILNDGIEKGEFKRNIDTDMVVATVFGLKSQLLNAPQICSLLLGYDTQSPQSMEEKLKPRVVAYLKKLLESYLLIENEDGE